jgi:uncharacterized protein YciI
MFLIIVDYKKPLEEVERYLAEHRAFLDRYFAQGKLLCTGPQNPRTGGVIVSKAAKPKLSRGKIRSSCMGSLIIRSSSSNRPSIFPDSRNFGSKQINRSARD